MTWGKRRAIVIVLVILFLVVLLIVSSKPRALRLPSNGVLVIDAMGLIEEQRAPDIFSAFTGSTVPVLHDYVDAIDAAATDSRIAGLVVRIAPLETGWGKLEEIRSPFGSRFARAASPASAISATTASETPNIIWPAPASRSGWFRRRR